MNLKWTVSQANLDPEFLNDVTKLLTASPDDWAVTFGYRSYTAQAALYAKYQDGGAEAAPPGESAHEHGLAIDVAWLTPGGGLSWDYGQPAFQWLFAAVAAHPRLHSGVTFPKPDEDHIEAFRWAHSQDGQPSVIAVLEKSGAWGKPPEEEA